MVFHWSQSDSKSPQVSRTLLSILADLNNAVVWMVSTRPLISKFSRPSTHALVIVPRAPITIGITVNFMFQSFSSFIARSTYSSLFLLSFSFTRWSAGATKSTIRQVLLFFLRFFFYQTITRSGRLAKIRWSISITKFRRILCVSFSRTNSGLCIYHLFVWSNLNFLHNSQWITLPTQSCLVLYSLCINLMHSLIMWLTGLSSLLLLLFTPLEFFTSVLADGFSLEFFTGVSRTRLSILAVLSNAVVLIVSTRPLTSKFSSK